LQEHQSFYFLSNFLFLLGFTAPSSKIPSIRRLHEVKFLFGVWCFVGFQISFVSMAKICSSIVPVCSVSLINRFDLDLELVLPLVSLRCLVIARFQQHESVISFIESRFDFPLKILRFCFCSQDFFLYLDDLVWLECTRKKLLLFCLLVLNPTNRCRFGSELMRFEFILPRALFGCI
jgi:hypothetical protein